MIDEGRNLHPLGKLRDPSDMIAMIVGDNQIIDLLDSRQLGGSHDPVGISAIESRPAGVDQHRLARGAYEERCLTTFNVERIDLKRSTPGLRGETHRKHREKRST